MDRKCQVEIIKADLRMLRILAKINQQYEFFINLIESQLRKDENSLTLEEYKKKKGTFISKLKKKGQ